jgi:hypothetical protein
MDRLRHALEHPSMVDSRTAEFVEPPPRAVRTGAPQPGPTARPDRGAAPGHGDRTADRRPARGGAAQADGLLRASRCWPGSLAFDRGDTASATACGTRRSAPPRAPGRGPARRHFDLPVLCGRTTRRSRRRLATRPRRQRARPYDPAPPPGPPPRRAYAAQLGEREAAERRSTVRWNSAATCRPTDRATAPRRGCASSTAPDCCPRSRTPQPCLKDPRAAYAAEAVDALGPAKVKSRASCWPSAPLSPRNRRRTRTLPRLGQRGSHPDPRLDVSLAADLLYEIVPLVCPTPTPAPSGNCSHS